MIIAQISDLHLRTDGRLEMPVDVNTGNHDDRDMMLHNFADQGFFCEDSLFVVDPL